jgi:preprotein translocase subunit SecG
MNLQPLAPYLSVVEIILAVALTVLVLMQTKGSDLGGFLGGGGGDSSGTFRTRRGVEATLHRLTIIVSILFFINTIFAFLAWGQAI